MAETITSITERLLAEVPEQYDTTDFNSHAPWGA